MAVTPRNCHRNNSRTNPSYLKLCIRDYGVSEEPWQKSRQHLLNIDDV